MRTLLFAVAAFTVACGGPLAPEDITASVAVEAALEAPTRCTAATLQPGWECCEEDSLKCGGNGPQVCKNHLWEPLTKLECERISTDTDGHPEYNAYPGRFCEGLWGSCVVPS